MTTATATAARVAPVRLRSGDISAALAAAARDRGSVYLDTETDGLDWAADELRTVQAYVPGSWTEIVRVGPTPAGSLLSLVEDAGVAKVLHHAMFDLRFIARRWGARPASVRCTKIAAKLVDPSGPHSLAPLLSARLGVLLDKTQQTSDWSADVLTDEQTAYAAGDVVHLPALLDSLLLDLDLAGLRGLYDACCAHLPTRVALETVGYGDVYGY